MEEHQKEVLGLGELDFREVRVGSEIDLESLESWKIVHIEGFTKANIPYLRIWFLKEVSE